jgi:hypothetical protein
MTWDSIPTLCFVCHAPDPAHVAIIRGTSNAKPRQKRPLCDLHAEQARGLGYKVGRVQERWVEQT